MGNVAVGVQRAACEKNTELARKAAKQIKRKEDEDYFLSELKTISC